MSELHFNIYFCGMSEETFSDQIMIYKPLNTITISLSTSDLLQHEITYVSDLLDHLKNRDAMHGSLGTWELDNLNISNIYIAHQHCLFGLRSNKTVSDIFVDFNTNTLQFAYFVVAGASIHDETSYRFTIHPDEKIHDNMPHVHVSKAGVEIRYSLETLQPIDALTNPHKRDNKKIITPFLKQHHTQLMEMWNYYRKGYSTPEITERGQQFYPES